MAKKKTIYRTVIRMEVLSDEPIGEVDMQEILNQTENGDWSGRNITLEQDFPLTGKKAANAVFKQGSDPEFFQMDKSGNELEKD